MTGKWYHFIGIGGVGMSGLAQVLLEMGMRVSGSDLVSSPVVESLRQRGAQIAIGHQAENIVDGLDAVVVSSAIPPSNIELSAACSKGLPVMTRGELLAKVMESYQGIAVTGSHGKTTTSAMIAVALAENGLDPTYLIGGHISELGGNAGLGKGRYLVAESDESDGSFLKQKPFIAVITNIDDDHLNYYRDISGILQAFQDFLSNIRRDGFKTELEKDKAEYTKLYGSPRVSYNDYKKARGWRINLSLASEKRPEWDHKILKELGYQNINSTFISERVYNQSKLLLYRSLPMFMIRADKIK